MGDAVMVRGAGPSKLEGVIASLAAGPGEELEICAEGRTQNFKKSDLEVLTGFAAT